MYATASDMRDRYGEARLIQLTDTAEWGAAAIAAIEVKLRDASVRADGYVAKYYQAAPGAPVPPLLVTIVCEIAYADLAANPTDEAKERRKEAIRDLVNISKGLIKLDQGDPAALEPREGQVLVPDADRIFSRDRLVSF